MLIVPKSYRSRIVYNGGGLMAFYVHNFIGLLLLIASILCKFFKAHRDEADSVHAFALIPRDNLYKSSQREYTVSLHKTCLFSTVITTPCFPFSPINSVADEAEEDCITCVSTSSIVLFLSIPRPVCREVV